MGYESHLKKYVKEKDLQAYNAALPSEEEINDYAHKMSVYKTITNGGVALKLRVLNKGTAKATDIRISIVFPKDIFVYDIDDIEKMKEPKAPKLPPNPIEKAEERFMSDLNPVYGLLKNSMDGIWKIRCGAYPCRRSCLFLLDTKTFWQACNLHYSRFGLGSREVARKRCIQVHSWRRKECCEICGRDHCSKQRRAEVFLGDLRKGDTFYP